MTYPSEIMEVLCQLKPGDRLPGGLRVVPEKLHLGDGAGFAQGTDAAALQAGNEEEAAREPGGEDPLAMERHARSQRRPMTQEDHMLMTTEWGKGQSPEANPEDLLRWYIVRSHAGGEAQLYDELLAKGIDAHWPHRVERVRRGRWRHMVLVGVFPGYVFAGLEPKQTSDDVVSIAPAMYILKAGNRPGDKFVEVPHRQMESIRLHAAGQWIESWGKKAMFSTLDVGDWVKAPEGTLFEGIPVEIEAIDKHGQISASIGIVKLSFHRSAVTETCTRPFKAIPQSQP